MGSSLTLLRPLSVSPALAARKGQKVRNNRSNQLFFISCRGGSHVGRVPADGGPARSVTDL